MAYSIMPKRGEPVTCQGLCEHIDCGAWHRMIDALCIRCQKPVRTGESYLGTNPETLEHFDCALRAVEEG
jgi:hypothetical protein